MKQDAFLPWLINFDLEYAISGVQVNLDGLKLNGALQLLSYADDVNLWCRSAHTVKKNIETKQSPVSTLKYNLMLIKLSTWSCLKIRMWDKVSV
jgi:hypothetical protein